MRNIKIYLGNPKIGSVPCDNSSKYIKYENDINPSNQQIKTENIEWNDGKNGNEEKEIDREQLEVNMNGNVVNEVRPQTHTFIVKYEDSNLDDVGRENGVRMDEISATQDIKHEPELEIDMTNDALDGSSTEIFKCLGCRYECGMRESLEKHIVDTHTEGQLCILCNEEFISTQFEHCSTHLQVSGTKEVLRSTNKKQYKCKICSKMFQSKSYLNQHLIIHTDGKPLKCTICLKNFRLKNTLADHLRYNHSGERLFKCEICSKTFLRKSYLTEHLKFVHARERPHKCRICPKAFRTKDSLADHLRLHTGERPFKCSICPKTFHIKRNLTGHLRFLHAGERPFKCEICLTSFQHKGNLTQHSRFVHEGERPYKCEICSKSFSKKKALMDHIKLHTEERKFKCEICSKSFINESESVNHSRSHTKERFKCGTCSKQFTHKSSLMEHFKELHLRKL